MQSLPITIALRGLGSRKTGRSARQSSAPASKWTGLWATVTPIWAVLVAGRVSYYGLMRLQYPDSVPPVSGDAVLGLLLLPLMVFGCFLTLQAWRRAGANSAVFVAIVTALIFGVLARPIHGLATFIDPLTQLHGATWMAWMSSIVEYVVLYLSCAAAAVGIQSYRGFKIERWLRTRIQARAARERLRTLRAQLNPHFLYNTLNSIVSLSEAHAESAEILVEHLSDLLRRTLAASECEEHALSVELAYIEAYLNVQRIRHPTRVTWSTEVAPGCTSLKVPSLILQPLVENAVKHGLRGGVTDLDIRIEIRYLGGRIMLAVSNNCLAAAPRPVSACDGFGLRCIRERLAVMYGEWAALEIDQTRPERFLARLRLPAGSASGWGAKHGHDRDLVRWPASRY